MSVLPRVFAGAVLSTAVVLATVETPRAGFGQTDPAGSVTRRVIVASSEAAAQRLLERLHAGESFATLARAESTAPSADSGGWLGTVPLAQLRPEVRRALAGVAPGQLTSVVPIPTGFAIFKVEEPEPARAAPDRVAPAIAASGAVRYMFDVSGFTEARASVEAAAKPDGWNMEPRSICDTRTRALAAAVSSIEAYLAPANRAVLASETPLDVMQLHFGLAQLHAYRGHMAAAIASFQNALRVADASVPSAVLQMQEALGIAYLHKAGMDNGLFAAPGDFCLLGSSPFTPYRERVDVERAIEHFRRYLEQKPDDLEVRWLLNLAYMAAGRYPIDVPPAHLIPAAALQSAEDVGKFRDVAPIAGLTSFGAAGAALVEDFRSTGRFDVITTSVEGCGPMRLLASNGDGTFSDRTAQAGLGGQTGGLNAVAGDYDNNGCQDVLVLRGGWEDLPQRKSLLRNNCDGTFTDVTVASRLAAPATTTQTAAWADVDNDGFLDLFVGNENGPAQLFHNTGTGAFEDVSRKAGVDRSAFTKGVAAMDYDNDRYPDLYVSNYGETNFLYHNNRDGTFTEMSAAARVPGTPTGFATWFFDYDNDGHQDLLVTSYVPSLDEMARDYLGLPHNATTMRLYRNLGDGTFRDISSEAGLEKVMMPMGSNFGDLDNDGFLDMYFGTGNPSYGALSGAVLLRNRDGKGFVNVTSSSGTGELHRGHGVAFADMDNDGDEDIVFEVGGVTPGDRHAMRLFENPGHGNGWIALKLVGVQTNRTAVGARIKVTAIDAAGRARAMHRVVGTGGSFGSNPLVQHVGLGKDAVRVDVEVWWPASGTRQAFENVGMNQWLQIEEFARRPAPLTRVPVRLGGAGRAR